MSILMETEILKCSKNKILYQEGQPITHAFLIADGEVEISKRQYIEGEKDVIAQLESFVKENKLNNIST